MFHPFGYSTCFGMKIGTGFGVVWSCVAIITGCWLIFSTTLSPAVSLAFSPAIDTMTHGFTLVRQEKIDELSATAFLFQHEKSGATLLYLACEDDNKVFSIAFRTPPDDDTGIAHILEHSVLCGSRKFPSKEPFVDLLKGSLQTFLNAMTYNDRTIYPVASRNDKDFLNLMDVYLDAVLYPNMKTTPEILMQEGWHYQIDPDTGKLNYNGIVYNEMKGVYSSPQGMLYRYLEQTLFPDATCGKDSGGNPDVIPNLTQKQFVEFHDRCYHPSNAKIYLYGNGDIEKHLEFLDREYLSQFDKKTVNTAVVRQSPFTAPRTIVKEYSVNEGDSATDKTFFAANYVVTNEPDAELYHSMDMLTYILLNADSAPLRRALLDANIALDVSGIWDDSTAQPYFSIILKNSNPTAKEKFLAVVDKTLRSLVENGLDPKLVEAAINRTEFSLREFQVSRYPKGLVVSMMINASWNYDGDPLMFLRYEPVLAKIKAESKHRYFEKLIAKYLLDNPFSSVLELRPKEGLDKAASESQSAKLEVIRQSLSETDLAAIKTAQEKLIARQSTPDTPEMVAKIPVLLLSDLEPKAEILPIQPHTIAGATVLSHDITTNGVVYMDFLFDAETLPADLVPIAAVLSQLLGRLDTENYRYSELSNEIDIHTGGIGTGLSPIPGKKDVMTFYPKYSVGAKVMLPKLPRALELMQEIMFRTKFEDKARIRELLQEERVGLEQSLMSAGNRFAQLRAHSHLTPLHSYREKTGGLTYYQFLLELDKNWETTSDELLANLKKVASLLFHRDGMIGSVTLPAKDFEAIQPQLETFLLAISAEKLPRHTFPFTASPKNEAVVIPSRVQYVCKAGDFRAAGGDYSGKMRTITNVLRTGYLWNQIRVLGGAYGSAFVPERLGVLALWSYRDPHLARTIETFEAVPEFLATLALDEAAMTKAIIASIGDLDKPLTPSEKGGRATSQYIVGLTPEEIQKERDEILKLTVDDIRAFAPILKKTLAAGVLCVFGGAEKIEQEKSRFDDIIKLQQ